MQTASATSGVFDRTDFTIPLALSAFMLVLQLSTVGIYGMFCDEFYYIACSKRLAFGTVDHPPLIDLLTWFARNLFGDSVYGLRLLPALAGSATVLLAAAIARNLGGGRFAQGLAALMIFVAPVILGFFNLLTMNAFDIMLCTLCAYILIKILSGASPQMWLVFGLVAGIGLQNKYTMLAFGFSVFIGLLLTRQRRLLATFWPYLGGILAAVIFLPNLLWQMVHGWPWLGVVRYLLKYANYPFSTLEYLLQLVVLLNPVSFPIWMAGLFFFLFGEHSRKYRLMGITAVVFFFIYVTQNSKVFYVLPIFPVLMAAGTIPLERLAQRIARAWAKPAIASILVLSAGIAAPTAIPILPIGTAVSYWSALGITKNVQMAKNVKTEIPLHFFMRLGREEMVEAVARAYSSLPEAEKDRCAILVYRYNDAAAIDYFGPQFNLPRALSGCLNYWIWGPGDYTGEVVIALGFDKESLGEKFAEVEPIALFEHPYGREGYGNKIIYVCRKPVASLQEMWPRLKSHIIDRAGG